MSHNQNLVSHSHRVSQLYHVRYSQAHLCYAVQEGDTCQVAQLLKCPRWRQRVNVPYSMHRLAPPETPLDSAAAYDDVAMVDMLLNTAEVDVNVANLSGTTALMVVS